MKPDPANETNQTLRFARATQRWIAKLLPFVFRATSILLIIGFAGVTYINILLPRSARVDATIAWADSMSLVMDANDCTMLSDRIQFEVVKPSNPSYSMRATDQPISVTLTFLSGNLIVHRLAQQSNNFATYNQSTKEPQHIRLSADSLSVAWDSSTEVRLAETFCLHGKIFYNANTQELAQDPPTDRHSVASLAVSHQFLQPGQVIRISAIGAELNDTQYQEIAFEYRSDDNYQLEQLSVDMYGEKVSLDLPGETALGQPKPNTQNLKLKNASVSEVQLASPVGMLSLERGEATMMNPPSYEFEANELRLGGQIPQWLPMASLLDARSYSISLNEVGEFVISGYGSSVVYQNRERLLSVWARMSPEVQAVFIGALLTVFVSLVSRLTSKDSTTKKLDSQPVVRARVIPAGYMVLVLSSGRTIAGSLIKKPNLLSRQYILKEVIYKDENGLWSNDTIARVSIDKQHVEYSYYANEEPFSG